MRPFEDCHVIAVQVRDMQEAVELINGTEFAHLLLHIVPVDGGFWLVWKADSGLVGRIQKLMPRVMIHR